MTNLVQNPQKGKRKDKSKDGKKLQSQQEKQPPEASQAQPQAPDETSHLAIMSLVTKGPGMRVSHLQSWSEKATKLTDKLMKLAEVSYIMEHNDAPTDENILFSDELAKTAEILIEKGKALLRKGAMIKLARAESIKRGEVRKQEELKRKQAETEHYHCYELACIPLTLKEEKLDDEISIIPRDPYDPYSHFDAKDVEHFYVKEEAFSCSSAEDSDPDIPRTKNKKEKKKKKSKSVLKQQLVTKSRVPMPMGKMTGASKPKKTIEGPYVCHVCGSDYMNEIDYVSHIGTHEGITFKCPQCDKEFRSRNSFKNHHKAELSGKTHSCDQCGKSFMLETSL